MRHEVAHPFLHVVLGATLLLTAQPSRADSPWQGWNAEDRDAWLRLGATTAVLIAADRPLTRAWQTHIEASLDGVITLPQPPGGLPSRIGAGADGWMLLGIGASTVGGWIFDAPVWRDTGLAAGEAVVASFVVSQLVLKSVAGRKRPADPLDQPSTSPDYTHDPLDWGHVHAPATDRSRYGTSFPSFHFTVFSAVARVWQLGWKSSRNPDEARAAAEAAGPDPADWVPWGSAALMLASEIRDHHHWVSDMTAGILIGHWLGQRIAHARLGRNGSVTTWTLTPSMTAQGVGLGLVRRF